ncbi:MAG: hypothetical protein KYX68_14080 [Flavobacterium sp.]|nr:hypothetical protein [Flavobacterium sp.]
MSKTIEIKKVHIRNLFLSFLLGFSILFGLEHFGTFSYKYTAQTDYDIYGRPRIESQVSYKTKVNLIEYKTYFKNTVSTHGNGFNIGDLEFSDTEFKKYSNMSYYYTKAILVDFKYGLYISLGLFLITLFFTNFKIKLS